MNHKFKKRTLTWVLAFAQTAPALPVQSANAATSGQIRGKGYTISKKAGGICGIHLPDQSRIGRHSGC